MGMGQVLSFAEARAERVRAKLCALAIRRSPGMIETRHGLIDARRIFCREGAAVLIDRYGYQTKLGYDQIIDVSPILPASDIIALADWQVMTAEEAQSGPATVLRFPTIISVEARSS
jgi:hypothetical protein